MAEIKLPFGMLLTGRMVTVEEVERGIACDCVCPECKAPLVACQGQVMRHHFRHRSEQSTCVHARETSLHRFAKQIICEDGRLFLPDYEHRDDGMEYVVDLGSMRGARQEVWLDGIRPDVLADYRVEQVAIEVFVTHRVPLEKLRVITKRGLATLEIDLSNYRNVDASDPEWRQIIAERAPRTWLCPPRAVREEIQRRERERLALMRRLAEEARRRAEESHKEKIRRDLELVALKKQQERMEQEAEQKRRFARELAEAEWRAAEAEMREHRLKKEEIAAERARLEQEARAKRLFEYRALKKMFRDMNAAPDLQALVEAHGGYDRIAPEAWERFNAERVAWQRAMAAGTLQREAVLIASDDDEEEGEGMAA
jgi:hypothetical protein